MGPLLIFLLALYHLQMSTHSEAVNFSDFNLSSYQENENDLNGLLPPEVDSSIADDDATTTTTTTTSTTDSIPFVKSGRDQTEVEFAHPISSVNIDYSNNVIVLKFRKQSPKFRMKMNPEEEEKRKLLETNFMRFGRSPADFMRLGKRQFEEMPLSDRYYEKKMGGRQMNGKEGMRNSRGDSFMRFGRGGSKDFLRFGRNPGDFMRFGRNPGDFMRFGRNPGDFMRFGRNPGDFMRFGRNAKQDFMRFGRAQKIRRQSDVNSFTRFGRPDNFMRFGRTPPEPSDESANFMRFGKSLPVSGLDKAAGKDKGNHAKGSMLHKTAPPQRSTDKDNDPESNPMDKAMKLFNKQQQDDERQLPEEADFSTVNEMDLDRDYAQNVQN